MSHERALSFRAGASESARGARSIALHDVTWLRLCCPILAQLLDLHSPDTMHWMHTKVTLPTPYTPSPTPKTPNSKP